MLNLPPSVRILLSREPVDMRKSFDSLAQLVREHLGGDPLSGHLFVFRSRRGDRIKLLHWDRDGYVIWYKRLEEGAFAIPEPGAAGTPAGPHGVEIQAADFAMILDGVDLASVRRRRRYRRPAVAATSS